MIREIIRLSRNSDFGTILDHIGAQKMPFLAHTGRKSNVFAMRRPAALHAKQLKTRLFAQQFACHRPNLPSIKRADSIVAT